MNFSQADVLERNGFEPLSGYGKRIHTHTSGGIEGQNRHVETHLGHSLAAIATAACTADPSDAHAPKAFLSKNLGRGHPELHVLEIPSKAARPVHLAVKKDRERERVHSRSHASCSGNLKVSFTMQQGGKDEHFQLLWFARCEEGGGGRASQLYAHCGRLGTSAEETWG